MRSRPTSCSASAPTSGTGCGCCRWTRWTPPALVVDPLFESGTVDQTHNEDFTATGVTVVDESYVHPPVWSDVDFATGARTERHRQDAPGHDPERYVSETRTFPSPDGTPVPATVVRHRDTPLDGSAPALLYGYGAYEATDEPAWDPALPEPARRGRRLRARPHPRRRRGRPAVVARRPPRAEAEHLHRPHRRGRRPRPDGLVDGSRIGTRGLSAGGLLQGAVLSQRPDRWRAVVAEVPFVDVVTTMLDPSIPLTVNEWDEWGDPRRKADFDWMLAYSPYDHLPPAGSRPDLLVTGALHDARVMVHEPAKWMAALRESDPEWSPRCLFRAETGAGAHAGPSGRFARLDYEAEVYAWLLDSLGVPTDARVSNG